MSSYRHRPRMQNRLMGLAAIIGGVMIALTAVGPLAAEPQARELVAFSPSQFPEGLTVAPDGTILVGILSTGEIMRVTPRGTASKFAQIPLPKGGILVGLAAVDSTNLYALVFSNDESNGVWSVSQHGMKVVQVAKLPVGALPNDLVLDRLGRLFITDTIGGRVFRVQTSGAVETWAQDRLLLGNVAAPGPLGFPLGANGVALAPGGDSLYVGVSEGARIVRIPIRADGSAGPLAVVAENPALDGADGIVVGPNGTIYVAVNAQNQIVAVDPATARVDVVASGSIFRFPAGPRFSPDFKTLYVTNFDGLVFFGLAPGPGKTGLLAIDFDALAPQLAAAIRPPRTGDAGLVPSSRTVSISTLGALVALAGAVVVSGGVFAARRRHDEIDRSAALL